MTITDHTLARARDFQADALEALLSAGYAPARRITHALTGSDVVARAVADLLVWRAVRMLPRWRDASSAENWFYHHAVLTTRTVNVPTPEPALDPLVTHGGFADDPSYVAFVRALRLLPAQQREAFILHHGERLNERLLAVAMDCSMQAAGTHLQAATDALQVVSANQVETYASNVSQAYAALRAAEPEAAPVVRVHVHRLRRRIWLGRLIRVAMVAGVLTAAGVVGWMFRDELLRLVK